MAFSDFVMKKQNQTRQIWKGLKRIAVNFKIYQLILMKNPLILTLMEQFLEGIAQLRR